MAIITFTPPNHDYEKMLDKQYERDVDKMNISESQKKKLKRENKLESLKDRASDWMFEIFFSIILPIIVIVVIGAIFTWIQS